MSICCSEVPMECLYTKYTLKLPPFCRFHSRFEMRSGEIRFADVPWPQGSDQDILSLGPDADRTALRAARLRWHPDKSPLKSARRGGKAPQMRSAEESLLDFGIVHRESILDFNPERAHRKRMFPLLCSLTFFFL